ncbi:MAG: DUF1289 domain-containing protein [Burkholderiales bacterium]|nr:DUF1289 domain-containing protein [Burkholderiales bacterium]
MTDPLPSPEAPVASPCINVCRMDAASGLCLGCARTLDEIASWSQAGSAQRLAVLQQLPARRAALGWPAQGESRP